MNITVPLGDFDLIDVEELVEVLRERALTVTTPRREHLLGLLELSCLLAVKRAEVDA